MFDISIVVLVFIPVQSLDFIECLVSFSDSTPWVIGGGGLNASAEALTRTPPLH
jgi:hypothetical protein